MTDAPTTTDASNSAEPLNPAEALLMATSVAGKFADEVHRDGRFPVEAIDALRDAHLLSALVPTHLGGRGGTIGEMVEVTRELAQNCANSAMVFAMHQIQVAMLVRHGETPELRTFLGELAGGQ